MNQPTYLSALGRDAAATRYLQWVEERAQGRELTEEPDAPFLSVLMRTQGKRFEALKEALLSLEAQTDGDFEVILILHRAAEQDRQTTEALVASLSPSMREKVTVRALESGTRAAPLNLALSLARGRYITMLDDDDLVFEDWIENFHKGALAHEGRAIRCYAMTQFWKSNPGPNGQVCLQAVATPEPTYCTPFDLQKHLSENYTPISCMAIPRACYAVFGISFDEALTTAEDWDFLMQCALLCGVFDTGEITFLYRLWQNAETSHTLHQNDEWLKNRAYIMEKLQAIPYVTAGSGSWPSTAGDTQEPYVMPQPTFWFRLRRAIRKYGPLRFPFVMLRKIVYRLFG